MEPTFTYLQKTNENPAVQGIFAFTLYLRKKNLENNLGSLVFVRSITDTPYAKGIQLYIDAIQKESSVFKDWKIILYTDTTTIELLQSENIFVGHPSVDFCIVDWPYYLRTDEAAINGDVLRCMRFRSFFDFPSIPVFVRDADTIFITDIVKDKCYRKVFKTDCTNLIYEWESNYLKGASKYPNTWIFGSSVGYKKDWHMNTKRGYFAPLGAFAGLQSVMPRVPCFESEDLWKKAVAYILEDSKRIEIKGEVLVKNGIEIHSNSEVRFSNNHTIGKIGKDERILLYIFFPACPIDHLFFFEVDIWVKRQFATKGFSYRNSQYPAVIFARESNTNIRNLFLEAVHQNSKNINASGAGAGAGAGAGNAPFSKNLEEKRKAILKQNRTQLKNKRNTMKERLQTLKNQPFDLDKSIDILPLLDEIHNQLRAYDYDMILNRYKLDYIALSTQLDKQKQTFLDTMPFENSNARIQEEYDELQHIILQRNKEVYNFLAKALELKSKEAIVESSSIFKRPQVKTLLDFYIASMKKGGYKKKKTLKKRK